jgi:4-diphosphocytidyl-2-C-methyl-D-erythritol kinase
MTGNLFKVRAPAKINLSLHVVGARDDGYHELRTIYQSIALHDVLTIRGRRGPFALLCDAPSCPADRTNLVWRAAECVWTAARRRGAMRDVEIHLTKRIPLQAGLGGGSSDAAATLRALGSLWRVDDGMLREIAASLGSDVPYFLEGGTVLGLDRGDRLYPLVDRQAAWVALVLPGFGVSTADAYRWWDEENPGGSKRFRPATLEEAGRTRLGPASDLGNDLQPVVAARHPEILQIVSALRRAGASHAAMSGSGSAVFGLFASRRAAVGAVGALSRGSRAKSGPGRKGPRRILVTRMANRAAYQRLAAITAHRINLPFAPRRPGHS